METLDVTTTDLTKLETEILDLRENKTISLEYIKAIKEHDQQALEYFERFGKTPRHRIMNLNSYRHALQYGFGELVFDEYGWLDNIRWLETETICFPVNDTEKYSFNHIDVACGKNRKWTYGLSYNYGSAGGGYSPNEFSIPYSSKEECVAAGVKDLKEHLQKTIDQATQRPDPTNYKLDYMKKVLQIIDTRMATKRQLTLFI